MLMYEFYFVIQLCIRYWAGFCNYSFEIESWFWLLTSGFGSQIWVLKPNPRFKSQNRINVIEVFSKKIIKYTSTKMLWFGPGNQTLAWNQNRINVIGVFLRKNKKIQVTIGFLKKHTRQSKPDANDNTHESIKK